MLRGLDIFLPHLMDTDHIDAENLPCWMLDTDHNGMAFYASQMFFPKTSVSTAETKPTMWRRKSRPFVERQAA